MKLKINGEVKQYQGAATLAALVEFLEMDPKFIAIELNGQLARRKNYGETPVADGDTIEIVTLVGGG